MRTYRIVLFMLVIMLAASATVLASDFTQVQVILSENNGANPIIYYFKVSNNNYTLLELMERKFVVEHTNGFITSIQGREASNADSTAWFFDINGEMAMVGANQYRIKDNDVYHWDLRSWK